MYKDFFVVKYCVYDFVAESLYSNVALKKCGISNNISGSEDHVIHKDSDERTALDTIYKSGGNAEEN